MVKSIFSLIILALFVALGIAAIQPVPSQSVATKAPVATIVLNGNEIPVRNGKPDVSGIIRLRYFADVSASKLCANAGDYALFYAGKAPATRTVEYLARQLDHYTYSAKSYNLNFETNIYGLTPVTENPGEVLKNCATLSTPTLKVVWK